MSDFPGASFDAWKTTERDPDVRDPEREREEAEEREHVASMLPMGGDAMLAVLEQVRHDMTDEIRRNTLDEVIGWLELAGERRMVGALRRAFDHWPANHVCSLVDGECPCGRR